MSSEMPTGTVTIMFTDIVGHTKAWEQVGNDFMWVLDSHNAILREATAKHNGYEVRTEGDAFMLAFAKASDAVMCAVEAQVGLAKHPWPEDVGTILVRMGIHTGEMQVSGNDYMGLPVIRAKRISDAGHGRQILISAATRQLILEELPEEVEFLDLGLHRLKDLGRPERIYQVTHPDLPERDFPPLRTLDVIPNNLPVQLTSFVGREAEIRSLSELLGKEQIRLVTLTGTAGIGKTRLSVEVAADQLDRFPDGVWFVSLESLTDPENVITQIASALSIQLQPRIDPKKQVIDYLSQKRLLLLLDNFEHLTEAASLVTDLLRGASSLRCLVTSRELLQVSGEQLFSVPSLSSPSEEADVETLSQYESVRLFIERAQSVKPDFQLTPQNAAAIASICHHLDGIPLAVELAAARVRGMTVQQILEHLSRQLEFLTTRWRDIPSRHRTLRAALDWSYELLDPDEQKLFAQLSIFSGGFFLEAAEKISDVPDVFELLLSLHDKSLLTVEEVMDQTRYGMLETLRTYAIEKLGGNIEIKRIHAEYYLTVAQDHDQKLQGAEQSLSLSFMALELDNFRAAMDFAQEQREWKLLGELGVALSWFFFMRGLWSEGIQRLIRVEEALRNLQEEDKHGVAVTLNSLATIASCQGAYDEARQLYTESLQIRRELGDKHGVAASLNNLGLIALYQGVYDEARQLCTESLQISRELEDKRFIAVSLSNIGLIAAERGAYDEAEQLHTESLQISRELGNKQCIAMSLTNLGEIAQHQEDYYEARQLYTESLQIQRELGDKHSIAISLNDLGRIAGDQGAYDEARQFCTESLQIRRELGDKHGVAASLNNLGVIAVSQGAYDEAKRLLTEALQIQRKLGDKKGIAESLHQLGKLAEAKGDSQQAALFLLHAVRLYDEIKAASSTEAMEAQEALAEIRKGISAEQFEKLKQQAETMSLGQVMELALS